MILMLGSNDMKKIFHATAERIEEGIAKLVETIVDFTAGKQGFVPDIILVSPPHIGEGIGQSSFYGAFDESSISLSKQLATHYEKVAEKYDCIFLDSAKLVTPSGTDSLHLTEKAHGVLAEKLYDLVKSIG